jgi:hypothetical protein
MQKAKAGISGLIILNQWKKLIKIFSTANSLQISEL